MGPHPLWLLEDLLLDMKIPAGARVLDLGCGKGATSVFLAKELGAEVWAVDLWNEPAVIEAAVTESGVGDRVHPVQASVHALPFEDEFFDAVVSIDAWEYFGTDDRVLPALLRVLQPGGPIGMATPGMKTDVRDLGEIPEHIRSVVGWEALTWHAPEWWRQQWELTGLVEGVVARLQEDGWDDWLRWTEAVRARPNPADPIDQEAILGMLLADGGDLLSFSIVSATKT